MTNTPLPNTHPPSPGLCLRELSAMHVTFRAPGGAHQAMKYGRTPQLPRWFVSCTRSPPFCFSFLHFFLGSNSAHLVWR